jgi:MFS family permease
MHMARTAVTTAFVFNGVVVGSWTSRVPAVTTHVHAEPASLGLALLGSSIGLIIAAPLASRLCARFGARLVVPPSVVLCAIALPLIGLAPTVQWLGAVMFFVGMAIGALDVSMNIAAVSVVRQLDRPLMPTFHAAYSFGALGGGVVAGLAVAIGWTPLRHFTVVAVIGVVLAVLTARYVPGGRPVVVDDRPKQPQSRFVPPIRRPAMWLMAGIMLGSAIAEGANGDWSALFLVRERGVAEAAATIGFACFNVAMAVARLLGERWERRWGPYRLLGGGAVVAAVGMFAIVLVPWLPVSYVGFALVGIGLAFSFPVTIGLAGAAGRRADGTGGEREIGFVTTIAYTGFLAGPPMIGAVAQATNLTVGLGVVGLVTALIVPMVLLARWARNRESRLRLQGLAETADGQRGADGGQAEAGGQSRDHAGADGHAQREIP